MISYVLLLLTKLNSNIHQQSKRKNEEEKTDEKHIPMTQDLHPTTQDSTCNYQTVSNKTSSLKRKTFFQKDSCAFERHSMFDNDRSCCCINSTISSKIYFTYSWWRTSIVQYYISSTSTKQRKMCWLNFRFYL